LAEGVARIKGKSPRLDSFLRAIVDDPSRPQSKLGKLLGGVTGGVVSEASNMALAKKGGFGYGASWIVDKTIGKAFDWTEDKIFVKGLKTHGYDEQGRRRFRPLMALDRKLHTFDPQTKKNYFRPTHALATSRAGQAASPPFKKIMSGITKLLKPFSKIAGKLTGTVGMAIKGAQIGFKVGWKVLKKLGGAALALWIYFLFQGLLPVIIGAMVGGTIGAVTGLVTGSIIGFQIGMALSTLAPPFAILIVPACTIMGGLIGLAVGLLSGTAIGATLGYIYAGHLGGATTLGGVGVGATAGFIIGTPIPVIGPIVGAIIGGFIGGAIGYAFGEWIIPFFKNVLSGIGIGGSGATASAAGTPIITVTGGGAGSAGIAAPSLMASAGQFAWAVPAVIVGVQTVSLINGMNAGAGFFNPYANEGAALKSAYINVTKTADRQAIGNNDQNKTIKFTIEIGAPKEALNNIVCVDQISVVKQSGTTTPTPPSLQCPAQLNLNETKTLTFDFTANDQDSVIINQITVTADTASVGSQASQARASVTVGSPPSNVPMGWPTTGTISQMPHSFPTHTYVDAVDIAAPIGTKICATHDGNASVYTQNEDGPYVCVSQPHCLGNYIIISSFDGSFSTIYAHLNSFSISSELVTRGTKIGEVDATGYVIPAGPEGSHLHYQFIGLDMAPPYVPPFSLNDSVQSGCQ
jgi:murein DD-endopeptidase MepM/ murein hydrolase activator NlpD